MSDPNTTANVVKEGWLFKRGKFFDHILYIILKKFKLTIIY